MLDVCLLGTGGMMPLPGRFLTSLLIRYNGNSILTDCGEGTQVAIRKKGWSVNPIGLICITHFHGDHISGLPGLLLSIGNSERTEPVTIIGPKGLESVVKSLLVIAPQLPFRLNFVEIEGDSFSYSYKGVDITAFKVKHNVPCYGYSFSVERAGKFHPEMAKANEVPLKFWNALQKGNTVTDGDKTYTPDMVLGESRRGLKVTYTTDTRPVESITEAARDADLFVCEGMYGDNESDKKAREKKHMTFKEAALIGAAARPRRMWLTHFSPSMAYPPEYIGAAKAIYKKISLGRDGRSIDLMFDDDEEEGHDKKPEA